jgi:hypothetical protein
MTHPIKEIPPEIAPLIERLRELCMAMPGATEKMAWGEPTFRVKEKMFAMVDNNHHQSGRVAVVCPCPPGAREVLIGHAPHRFFVPPYVGHKGWIGARLDMPDTDWDELAMVLEDAWRMVAPAKFVAGLGKPASRY